MSKGGDWEKIEGIGREPAAWRAGESDAISGSVSRSSQSDALESEQEGVAATLEV